MFHDTLLQEADTTTSHMLRGGCQTTMTRQRVAHLRLETIMTTRTFVDVLGRAVQLPHSPQRLVSLVPSITEVLFSFGRGQQRWPPRQRSVVRKILTSPPFSPCALSSCSPWPKKTVARTSSSLPLPGC